MDHNYKVARRLAKIIGPRTPIPPGMQGLPAKPPKGPRKLAAILCDTAKRLAAMDRFERRALGRRRRAIAAYYAERRLAAVAVLRGREQTNKCEKCQNEATGEIAQWIQ